ncbi:hypothetical protein CWI36_0559p0010 [Hamiltosporidium magnivora]|uniref:Uncharacterized protein n=1 Tax=Hamiltosporidium magnivora TaxID=148818 RepID=A0A4Q9LD49_9MICR|nr:hypothetical protein CWI36_0559p0010 [Hamiltosporidium magnivora]
MSAFASMYRINYQMLNNIVKRYLKTGLVFVEKRGGDRRSELTLEIKESLQTFVDLDTFNVDVPTSKIDRTLGIPITLQNV